MVVRQSSFLVEDAERPANGANGTISTLSIPHRVARHGAWGNKCQQEINDVGGAGRHRLIPVALTVTMCSRRHSAEATPSTSSRKGQSRVILHELYHLKEHNHSKRYYALLDQVLPGWREQRTRLNNCEFR